MIFTSEVFSDELGLCFKNITMKVRQEDQMHGHCPARAQSVDAAVDFHVIMSATIPQNFKMYESSN